MFLLLTVHCLLLTSHEFRTGLELGGNLPRAYLQIVLDEGRSYHLNTCAKVLDVACKPLGAAGECYDPCQSVENDPNTPEDERAPCWDAYAQVAGAVYGVWPACGTGEAVYVCFDEVTVNDTPNCVSVQEEREGMPYRLTVAPLDENGNVVGDWVGLTGWNKAHEFDWLPTHGTRTYSFGIEPQNLFVPTEGETGDPDNPDRLFPENTLSLFEDPDHDGAFTLKDPEQQRRVLKHAEGAYVEGVIRFE